MKKYSKLLIVLAVFTLLFTACSSGSKNFAVKDSFGAGTLHAKLHYDRLELAVDSDILFRNAEEPDKVIEAIKNTEQDEGASITVTPYGDKVYSIQLTNGSNTSFYTLTVLDPTHLYELEASAIRLKDAANHENIVRYAFPTYLIAYDTTLPLTFETPVEGEAVTLSGTWDEVVTFYEQSGYAIETSDNEIIVKGYKDGVKEENVPVDLRFKNELHISRQQEDGKTQVIFTN